MAEETAIAEPAAPAGEEATFDFNNLGAEMDRAFPATAVKEETPAAPAPAAAVEPSPVVPAPAPVSATPAPEQTPADPALPPDDVFGDKPAPPPAPPKEYDAPDAIKKDPKVYKNWNEVRRAEEEATARATKLETEMVALREKAEKSTADEGLIARAAELETVNKELSERISTVDLMSHPEFQRQFVQARQRMVGNAVEIAKEAGIDAGELERAINLNGKAKIEALDEIVRGIDSPTTQAEIGAIVKDINTLDRNARTALSESKGNLERLKQHAKAQEYAQIQEHAKFIDKTVTAQAARLAENVAFFRKIDGNEEWNKKVDTIVQTAKEVATNGKDEGQLLGGLLLGAAFPEAYNALVATRKALQKERALNAELKGADPGLSGGRGEPSSDTPADKNLSFADAVARGSGLL